MLADPRTAAGCPQEWLPAAYMLVLFCLIQSAVTRLYLMVSRLYVYLAGGEVRELSKTLMHSTVLLFEGRGEGGGGC